MAFDERIVVSLIPVVLGSAIGYSFRPGTWYSSLRKPELTPKPIVFSIVWPILYLCIGVSAAFALHGQKAIMWVLPVLQLTSNLMFAPVTFGLKSLSWGTVVVLSTLVLAILTTLQFFILKANVSVLLMMPYIAWLCFATYLSFKTYSMNKHVS